MNALTARPRPGPGALRVCTAAVTVLAAVAALAEQAWYRATEAVIAGIVVHEVLGCGVIVVRSAQAFFFLLHEAGRPHYLGLDVSLGCSSLLIIVPAMLLTATIALISRIAVIRLVTALTIAATLVLATNMLRLLLIAVLANAWGIEVGFGWAHSFFGSLITLAGMPLAAFAYYRVALRHDARLGEAETRDGAL